MLRERTLIKESGKAIGQWISGNGNPDNDGDEPAAGGDSQGPLPDDNNASGDEDQAAKEDDADIKTKADLFKIYKGKGPHKMYAELTANDDARLAAKRRIAEASR